MERKDEEEARREVVPKTDMSKRCPTQIPGRGSGTTPVFLFAFVFVFVFWFLAVQVCRRPGLRCHDCETVFETAKHVMAP
jgi:hypothetical protein